MIEKEIERYFNERLSSYKKALRDELITMFGKECDLFILEALEVSVVYQVKKSNLDFYVENKDSLDANEQNMIDYFMEKLGEDEIYIIGSSERVITDLMKEYISYAYFRINGRSYINVNVIFDPTRLYTTDEEYICSLLAKMEYNFQSNYEDTGLFRKIRWTLSCEIVRRMHSKGYYLFDNKNLVEQFKEDGEVYDRSVLETQYYTNDRNLLKPILNVLPLYFTNQNEFFRIVGKDNFDRFKDAFGEGFFDESKMDEVYDSVDAMKESMEKSNSTEIIMIDINTITKALKSMRNKQQKESNIKEISTNGPILTQVTTKPISAKASLFGDLDLTTILNKIKLIISKNDNLQPIINNYGEKIMYIDANGKDTLDPPSTKKR